MGIGGCGEVLTLKEVRFTRPIRAHYISLYVSTLATSLTLGRVTQRLSSALLTYGIDFVAERFGPCEVLVAFETADDDLEHTSDVYVSATELCNRLCLFMYFPQR